MFDDQLPQDLELEGGCLLLGFGVSADGTAVAVRVGTDAYHEARAAGMATSQILRTLAASPLSVPGATRSTAAVDGGVR